MTKRYCIKCGTLIERCDGFVNGSDFVAMLEGRRQEMPRETCGRCVLRHDLREHTSP